MRAIYQPGHYTILANGEPIASTIPRPNVNVFAKELELMDLVRGSGFLPPFVRLKARKVYPSYFHNSNRNN